MVNANGRISSTAVNTALNLMSVVGPVMAPTHMASTLTSNLGQAVSALPNQPQSSMIRPGQVPYMAPTSSTAAIPRPYMAPPAAQLPAASVHPGASIPQTLGTQAGYLGIQSPWQPGQPRYIGKSVLVEDVRVCVCVCVCVCGLCLQVRHPLHYIV